MNKTERKELRKNFHFLVLGSLWAFFISVSANAFYDLTYELS